MSTVSRGVYYPHDRHLIFFSRIDEVLAALVRASKAGPDVDGTLRPI